MTKWSRETGLSAGKRLPLQRWQLGELLRENEAVTVVSLVQKTGLSREFFYKNEKVRNCLARAREQQRDQIFQRPQKALFDRAMEAQLEETKRQLIRERKDKEKLEEEVSRLQKALKKKDINLLRKL